MKYYQDRTHFLKRIIFFLLLKTTKMKKYELKPQTFTATKFDGDYDHIEQDAEAYAAGSSDSFDFNQHHKSLSFTDANGSPATITPGDYLKAVGNDDGSFKGYVAVPAADGDANWQEVADTTA